MASVTWVAVLGDALLLTDWSWCALEELANPSTAERPPVRAFPSRAAVVAALDTYGGPVRVQMEPFRVR